MKLAHLQHYTNAAGELHITQPNLTHAIHGMEEELGVCLFEKKGRNVALTKYGEEFLGYAEQSLAVLDYGIEKMKQVSEGRETIRLGFLRTLGTAFVPGLLAEYAQTDAGKKVSFVCYDGITRELTEMLKRQECDLIFSSGDEKESNIEFIPVVRRPLYLIVARESPLAGREEISLQETEDLPYILFHPKTGMRQFTDHLFAQHHFTPKCLMEIEEDEVIAGFVGKNFGVSIMHDMDILDTMPVKKLRLQGIQDEKVFCLGYLKEHVHSPAIREFIRYLKLSRQQSGDSRLVKSGGLW